MKDWELKQAEQKVKDLKIKSELEGWKFKEEDLENYHNGDPYTDYYFKSPRMLDYKKSYRGITNSGIDKAQLLKEEAEACAEEAMEFIDTEKLLEATEKKIKGILVELFKGNESVKLSKKDGKWLTKKAVNQL